MTDLHCMDSPNQEGPKRFWCKQCGANYNRRSTLAQHRCLQPGDLCYPCNICGQIFGLPELLDKHHHIHLETFKCPVCGKCFNNRGSLTTHHRSHKLNPYTCDSCQQSFAFKTVFEHHKCESQVFAPFTCGHCIKSFRRKEDIEQHHCFPIEDEGLFALCEVEEVVLVPVSLDSDAELADDDDRVLPDQTYLYQPSQDSELKGMFAPKDYFIDEWNPVVKILRQPELDVLAEALLEQKDATILLPKED